MKKEAKHRNQGIWVPLGLLVLAIGAWIGFGWATSVLNYAIVVSIGSAGPTPTPVPGTQTPTPTSTPGSGPYIFWQDHFIGSPGSQPAGWYDETQDPNHNAEIAYSTISSYAAVTRTADAIGWGKVLSPGQTCNVDTYPIVYVNVARVGGGNWKIGIQENEGSYRYWDLNTSSNSTGTFSFNYKTTTGWSGVHTFSVQLVVEGSGGAFIEVNEVGISQSGTAPTPTPTATPATFYWEDHFIGTPGNQPVGWYDETQDINFNAEIAYSSIASYAAITRTADAAGWGKVLSPGQTCNVDIYPQVQVIVTGVSNASWKIGIQENEGSYRYWDLNASSTSTGIFTYNYKNTTGWSGTHAFSVQLVVEGAGGASVVVDEVGILP